MAAPEARRLREFLSQAVTLRFLEAHHFRTQSRQFASDQTPGQDFSRPDVGPIPTIGTMPSAQGISLSREKRYHQNGTLGIRSLQLRYVSTADLLERAKSLRGLERSCLHARRK